MDDLETALAELRRAKAENSATIDTHDALDTVLNAVLSGDLVPKALLDAMISRAREVKPLVWGRRDTLASPLMECATSALGDYEVSLNPWNNGKFPMFPPNGKTLWLESEEAAKAAAQADYTARIHAALRANATDASEGER